MANTSTPESKTKVIDFAIPEEGGGAAKLEGRKPFRKRVAMLMWNPRARNLRRGLLRRWIEEC
jgi:hypothetical protein